MAKEPGRRPTAEEVLARVGATGEEWSGAVRLLMWGSRPISTT
ncbi:hypothetical protein [Streptomyces sp. ISL-43]|nr:hypothetical protein [Streptomyces sp. ISL-43]